VEVPVAVVLDLLDAACSAGASVPGALGAVGRAVGGDRGVALERVAAGLALGAAWDEAWAGAPRGLGTAGDALRPAWEVGAAPGGGLRSAGRTLRREEHGRALAAAGRLGVHLVLPLGLCYLPAFVLVGLVPVLISMGSGVLG
jgi:Flp pilus assembly protein TadB